jgi:hypothetical protein
MRPVEFVDLLRAYGLQAQACDNNRNYEEDAVNAAQNGTRKKA